VKRLLIQARRTLLNAAIKTVKPEADLRTLAQELAKGHLFINWVLFKDFDWNLFAIPEDKHTSHAIVRGSDYYSLCLVLLAYRADYQDIFQNKPNPTTFRLVMEITLHDHLDTHAWINAETGEVTKSAGWLKNVDNQPPSDVGIRSTATQPAHTVPVTQ